MWSQQNDWFYPKQLQSGDNIQQWNLTDSA